MVPKNVIAAVDDMFFIAKIRGTAEAAGVRIQFVRSIDSAIDLAVCEPASLIIVDLQMRSFDPMELARRIRSDENLSSLSLLGFFSHVQTELQQQAKSAGYDRILPRSLFSKNLSEILEGNV